jgi:hypothetical protein
VGFGDIVPVTTGERIYVILLMVLATCLFSRLMGDIQDMLRLYTSAEAELAERMDGVVSFLRSSRVPVSLQHRIRAWASFKIVHDRADARLKEVIAPCCPVRPAAHMLYPFTSRRCIKVCRQRSSFSEISPDSIHAVGGRCCRCFQSSCARAWR